jgi:bifunctional DNase/RNase
MRHTTAIVFAALVLPLAACHKTERSRPSCPPTHVEMSVLGEVPQPNGSFAVILVDQGRSRFLDVYVAGSEAMAIDFRLRHQRFVRPLTADLLESVIGDLGAEVAKVQVDELRDNTFIGTLYVRKGDDVKAIDARPSDCMALALGAHAPIYVARHVLDQAGLSQRQFVEKFEPQTLRLADEQAPLATP